MAMIEDAIVNLKVDDSDASSKWLENKEAIKDLNAELRRMKEAGEVGSDGYKEIQRELKDLKAEQKEMLHNVDLTTASINQMQDAVNFWTREAKKAEQGSEEWVNATKKLDEIKPILNEAQSELRSFGHEVEKQPSLWDSMKVSVLSVFTGLGLFELVKSAASAMFDFGMEVFEITAKFEKYDAILTNSLGSHEAAKAAMDDIKNIAATTPFSVDELTNSYIKYVNRGLTPTMEEMTKLGDIASSQGKSFEQLTEAVLDAGTGEFERLKEFGIQAKKAGDEVTFSFKGVQTTVANTPEAINGAIMAFGEMEGVQGSMAAISGTLEGRVSNLGDSYDSLMLILGDGLKPVFDTILDVMNWGIDTAKTLFTSLEPLVAVYESLWETLGDLWDMFTGVLKAMLPVETASFSLRDAINILSIAAQAVSTPFRVAIAVMQAFYDGLLAVENGAKQLANFFGADFKIDTTHTFASMKAHWDENMGQIKDSWSKTMTGVHVNNLKDALDHSIETENEKFEKAKERIGKEKLSEQEKFDKLKELTKDHNDDIDGLKKDSLKKQATEHIRQINESHLSEEEKEKEKHEVLAKFQAEYDTKHVLGHKKKEEDKTKISKTESDKRAKAEADIQKKIDDMAVKAIADDTTRLIAKANLDYKREIEAINKSKASQAKKNEALVLLEKNHENNIAKINADARKKEEAEAIKAQKEAEKNKKVWLAFVKAIKDQELKDTKALLDAEFIAKIDNAKVSLALAKDGSQAEFEAKKAVLDAELAYKRAKLNAEADAERARIADSISSNETKAQRLKAVEDKLSADLILTEAQTADAKNKIDQAATDEKNRRKEEFYKGLNLAMQGDLNGFIKYLQEKSQKDTKYLDERKAAQLKQANEIGAIMLTAVNTLMDLNKKYTEDKLAKLEIEKKANEAKLKADYEKGIITKEELDEGLLGLQGKFDADSMALKKKEFDRNKRMQIAMSAIQGSMAVLNALATPPWPVGLVMALAAGVKTAIDIKKIKSQQFEGASGGTYFKNAGIARGGRHGSKYGEGGIAMYDRATGAEVGEIEGDEPVMVLSRNTYKNNGPLIERLLHSSLHKNGAPVTLANGGIVPVSDFKYGEMHLFGSKKKKAAARAEMEAAQAEYAAMEAEYDAGADVGIDGETQAMLEQNTKIIEDQLKALEAIEKTAGNMADLLKDHSGILQKIADKDSGAASLMHAIERVQDNISKATLKG